MRIHIHILLLCIAGTSSVLYSQRQLPRLVKGDYYYHYEDSRGKWIVQREFRRGTRFPDEPKNYGKVVAFVQRTIDDNWKYRWAAINTKGKFLSGYIYDKVKRFKDGYILFKNDSIGLMDNYGNLVSDFQYRPASKYYYGYAESQSILVKQNNKVGAVTLAGKALIPFEYDTIIKHVSPFYILKKQGQCYLFLNTGKLVTPIDEDRGLSSLHGAYEVSHEGKHGVIDLQGEWIMPMQDSLIQSFRKYFVLGMGYRSPGQSLYDTTGKRIMGTDKWFDYPFVIDDTLFLIREESTIGSIGLINSTHEFILPPVYKDINKSWQYPGCFEVKNSDDKWGIINSEWESIIPVQFDEPIKFSSSNPKIGFSRLNEEAVLIDSTGDLITKLPGLHKHLGFYDVRYGAVIFYNSITHHHYTEVVYAVSNINGKEILPYSTRYNYVNVSHRGLIMHNKKRYNMEMRIMNLNGDSAKHHNWDGISYTPLLNSGEIIICKNCTSLTVRDRDSYIASYSGGDAAILASIDSVYVPLKSQRWLNQQLLASMRHESYSYKNDLKRLMGYPPRFNTKRLYKELSKMEKVSLREFLDQ